MIEAQVAHVRQDLPWDLGMHEFAVLPRIGETVLMQTDGNIVELVVTKVIHHSQLGGGPREPWVLIHAIDPDESIKF